MSALIRRRLLVRGIVQGVGFRPFVARLAARWGLVGWVRNTGAGVVIEVEGAPAALAEFAGGLEAEPPGAAVLEHVAVEELAPLGEAEFLIHSSWPGGEFSAGLPPDLAMCADCRRELEDPTDRRFGYAFLNCTACGPRYSIVEALPYDRARTTMRDFRMCAACRAEYENPSDRRYHAQPVACPACGPQLRFEPADMGEPIQQAVAALVAGQIGAIRGVGGFHLACDARNGAAVQRLRERKARGSQPFALMVRNVEVAREWVELGEQAGGEQAMGLLQSATAPIVLVQKVGRTAVGDSLAPGNGYLGIMLPYSPLHHLLLHGEAKLDALVMTSGNAHGEPMLTSNSEALALVGSMADFALLHDREIVAPSDDSVVRLYRGRALAIRRGRGYAPMPMQLPIQMPMQLPKQGVAALAMGADLKVAPGVSDGRRVYLGPHIGDMENVATWEALERCLKHLSELYQVRPEVIYHDAHPGYLSTQWALRYAAQRGWRTCAVQHHRAHVASVMAEYGLAAETHVVAVVFDGTGYGDDGAIWGGEFFRGTVGELERVQHLPYVMLPGGDASAKRPALVAVAHLAAAGIDWVPTAAGQSLTEVEQALMLQQVKQQVNCHASSSMGRLFDAAASLLGIRHRIAYEAQAAIEMEALAAQAGREGPYLVSAWNLAGLWDALLQDRASVETRARRFTATIARWTFETVQELAEPGGTVVLSGGVFQNVLLLEELTATLELAGYRVLVPRLLPPNDGGIALGQLYLGGRE